MYCRQSTSNHHALPCHALVAQVTDVGAVNEEEAAEVVEVDGEAEVVEVGEATAEVAAEEDEAVVAEADAVAAVVEAAEETAAAYFLRDDQVFAAANFVD
jgi:hypothetical protein